MNLDLQRSVDAQMQAFLRKIDAELRAVGNQISPDAREVQNVLDGAAEQLANAIRSVAPVAGEPIKRKKKNGKYSIYTPGNLKRSIQVLMHMKDKRSKYVGPYVIPKAMDSSGTFSGDKVDGWYAHIVEAKTPFIRPAVMQNEQRILTMVRNGLQAIINRAAR